MRHIQGEDRHQRSLLPDSVEDFVDADNPIRVIDAYIDSLDVVSLGFDKAVPHQKGRKPYDPRDLLKLLCVRVPEPRDLQSPTGDRVSPQS